MDFKPEEKAKVKLECLRMLATLRLNLAKMELISGFVDSYLRLNQTQEDEFNQQLK